MRMFSGGRRRNGSSARYPANDSMTIDTIPEVPGEESSSGTRRNLTTASSSRPTLGWPFQSRSISHGGSIHHSTQPSQSTSNRRRSSGWINLRPASSVLGSDVIPDYVVHFMRGETPETLARKREQQQERNPQTPEYHAGSNRTGAQSWVADFFPAHSRSGSRVLDLEAMATTVSQRSGSLGKFLTGWRGGVTLNIMLATPILIASVTCIALAATSDRLQGHDTIISTGSCDSISATDQALQAVGNILGVFFIAGASYVSQVLVSPTREEVAAAHAKSRWVDIGVPSLRNMAAISIGRAILSAVTVFTAVACQLMYNSLVFNTQTEWTEDTESCSLALNGPLLGAVGCLNLLFILALVFTLIRPTTDNQLVTLGDAIASFLTNPDPSTEGACLLAKDDVTSGRWAAGEIRGKYWFPDTHRWMQTPSKLRWLLYLVTWLLPTGMAVAMLSMAVVDGSDHGFSSLAKPSLTYALPVGVPRLGLSIVIALPHLLLVALYFSTNSLLSVFYLSHEFSHFAGEPTPLRISSCDPVGTQYPSIYLTLPRPISWVLYIVFVTMAFMLNQAFNLVADDQNAANPALGVNPLPLAVLLGLLAFILLLLLGLSLRGGLFVMSEEGHKIGNALCLKGGSCSVVISSRCHRSAREGDDIAAFPLVWGAVSEETAPANESKVGHAALSSQPVDALKVGKTYA